MSLRSSAIYENRINKGIYLGTPVWYLGSDPLNLGSMTRFDKFSRGTHLPLSKCFLQNINFANKNKNYGYGGPLQPTTTSVMTHRICFFPAMHPTPITPVKKRQSNSSSIQVKRRLDLPSRLPRRRLNGVVTRPRPRSTRRRSRPSIWIDRPWVVERAIDPVSGYDGRGSQRRPPVSVKLLCRRRR
jgi:hypothetical protein